MGKLGQTFNLFKILAATANLGDGEYDDSAEGLWPATDKVSEKSVEEEEEEDEESEEEQLNVDVEEDAAEEDDANSDVETEQIKYF